MDNLAREAMIARKSSMSYGKWKAMQEPVKVEDKPIPEGWKACIGCGKPFKPHDVRQRYCESICQHRVNIAKNRKRAREYERRKRENEKYGKG